MMEAEASVPEVIEMLFLAGAKPLAHGKTGEPVFIAGNPV